jgi:hypothetical protein
MNTGYTAQGHAIYIEHPERQTLDFKDFIRHLGNYRRFRGAGLTVLQHSCLTARLSPSPALVPFLAIHDLHETYIGDLDPVMKGRLKFHLLEAKWESIMVKRILGADLSSPELDQLIQVDLWAAALEAKVYGLGAFAHFLSPVQRVAESFAARESIRAYMHYLSVLSPLEQYEELTRWAPKLHNLYLNPEPQKGDA